MACLMLFMSAKTFVLSFWPSIFETAKKLRQWVAENKDVIKSVFGGQGYNNIERVAMNTYRRRAIDAVRTGGQSNTPEDIINAVKRMPQEKTVLDHLANFGVFGTIVHSPWIGAATAVGKGAFQSIKSNLAAKNAATMDAMELRAALDPEFAKILFQKAENFTPKMARDVAKAIRRTIPPVVINGTIAAQLSDYSKENRKQQ